MRTRQSVSRNRKQLVQYEQRGCVTLPVNPLEVCIESMSRRTEKVHLGVVKRHSLRDLAVYVWKRNHQTGEESRIRNLVDYGWTRRQCAILNSQMRNTSRNAVARAVPAPNRSVVHSQRGKQRRLTTRQNLERILVRFANHDATKTSDLIVKEIDDRILH